MIMIKIIFLLLLNSLCFSECRSVYSLYGQPKYLPTFSHYDYVNPNAPKQGRLVQSSIGSFDTLNQFVPQGIPAAGLSYLYDTLMVRPDDEPDSQYGLVAQCIELSDDQKTLIFRLDPNAKFHDGVSIQAEDVVWTFNTLLKKGDPRYKLYYRDVKAVKAQDRNTVIFTLSDTHNQDLIFAIGGLPVLPKHFWDHQSFTKADLTVPLGSGPYQVKDFKVNSDITYSRVKDYWAANHPTRKGQFNFDELKWVYFKDDTVAFEAFKSHLYDLRVEHRSKLWATGYQGPAVESGEIIKEEIMSREPQGMQGFVFNFRRPIFKDRQVRKAIALAFDFNWVNSQLFYSQYQRASSYYNNSHLAAGAVISPHELTIYNQLDHQLPEEFFVSPVVINDPENEAQMRDQLLRAAKLLDDAGWVIENGWRVNKITGERLIFEILITQASFERVILPYQEHLKRLGIDVVIRKVGPSEYVNRIRSFDFDMTTTVFRANLNPGNELFDYWSSKSANVMGSGNISGIADARLDQLIQLVMEAKTRDELEHRVRALDRLLMWEYIVVPQWYLDIHRVAYWNSLLRPEISPDFDLGLMTWWSKDNLK